MGLADRRVVFTASDQRDLVAVNLGLALTRRPFQAVNGGACCGGLDAPFSSLAGIVTNVVRISISRGFAGAGVLVAKLGVGGIGKPSEHSRAIRVFLVLTDGAQALAIGDLGANVVSQGGVERGGSCHEGTPSGLGRLLS